MPDSADNVDKLMLVLRFVTFFSHLNIDFSRLSVFAALTVDDSR